MIRTWLTPLAAALTAGLVAFAIARRVTCPDIKAPIERLKETALMTRTLELTPDQQAQIASWHIELAAALEICCDRHCAARLRLGEALTGEPSDDEALTDAWLQDMGRAYLESERAILRHIRQVRTILNPEQRARFDRMIKENLCRSCPTGAACAGPGNASYQVDPNPSVNASRRSVFSSTGQIHP